MTKMISDKLDVSKTEEASPEILDVDVFAVRDIYDGGHDIDENGKAIWIGAGFTMREFLDFMNGEEPREDEMVCVSDLEFEAIGPGYIVLSVGSTFIQVPSFQYVYKFFTGKNPCTRIKNLLRNADGWYDADGEIINKVAWIKHSCCQSIR